MVGGAPELIEREEALGRVDARLRDASVGRGGTLLLEGPPGIGKTALLEAASGMAADTDIRILWARGSELEHDLGFAVVRQLLGPPLRELGPNAQAELLAGAAALAEGPLGLDPDAAAAPGGTGSALHGLYWLCANLTDLGPVLVVVDDLQWADEPSVRFISYLANRAADHPLLVCAARRSAVPEDRGQLLAGLEGGWNEVIELRPLTDGGVAQLVHATLSEDAAPEFCDACARASGGNPFLLVEALAALRTDGIEPTAGEAQRLDGLRPETISRAMLARIARLGPGAQGAAAAIAVLGADATLPRVAKLAELDVEGAGGAVQALQREAILATGELEFTHPLVLNAVYSDYSEPTRGLAHLQAARLLEAEGQARARVAAHLLAAEPTSDEWVVETLRAEATAALTAAAPDSSAALLARALAEPPPEAERVPLLLELGRAQARSGNLEGAADSLSEGLERTEEQVPGLQIAMELGQTLRFAGRVPESLEVLERAREGVDATHELAVPLEVEIAMTSHVGLPATEWIGRLGDVASNATGSTAPERTARALYAYAAGATGSRNAEQVATTARSVPLASDGSGDPPFLLQTAGIALAMAGKLGEAASLLDRALQATRELGDAGQFGFASLTRSFIWDRIGRFKEAEADARAGVGACDEGPPLDLRYAVALLLVALIERGRLDEAQATLTEHGLDDVTDIDTVPGSALLSTRGRLRMAQGRPKEAVADLTACGEIVARAELVNPTFMEWRSDLAQSQLVLGDRQGAHELASEELTLARDFEGKREIGMALRTVGLIEGGERGLELLSESVAELEDSESSIELARSLVERGAALRRSGRRRDAQEELRHGLDVASRCDADGLADRAREELRTAGARPRRTLISGPESLTASELRVAEMAARGQSNPEIAQALFVTRRTVEGHLTSAYRKLDIESREQLPDALADGPAETGA